MRWPRLSDVSVLWTYQFRVDVRALERWAIGHPEALIVGAGVVLRVVAYLWNRAMWLDESMLMGSVRDVPILYFAGPLKNHQMAPIGFLIAERTIAAVAGTRNYAMRFLPLAAGIGALFLFRRLAGVVLPGRAALLALVLFAFSDDLVYYASEFKPYSLDVFAGTAVTLGAASILGRGPTTRAVAWLAVLVAAAPWFSFGSAFVVAGCGLVLVVDAVRASRLKSALAWALVGLIWLANFLVSLRASQTQLVQYSPMWGFWDFAFLPIGWPPTGDGLLRSAGLLLEVFINPLNLLVPGGTQLGVILPLFLLLSGGVFLARRSATTLLLLVAPIALAMAASIARRYPFHGRLILELVPAMFLIVAAGTEWVARQFRTRSGVVYTTLFLALLTFPCWDACCQNMTRRIRDFNTHGDLHDNVFIDVRVKASRSSLSGR
jgi:hypothetical protein